MLTENAVLQGSMASSDMSLAGLSDDQLITEVHRLANAERGATAALIRSLMELDARRLYLGEGCASLFTYCTQVLHLAEGSAYNRIEAARAARRFPVILDALADGSLSLTAVRLLAPHLTNDNHRDVLASVHRKSKREVELVAVALRPQPPVPTVIRKLPNTPVALAPSIIVQPAAPSVSDPKPPTAIVAPPVRMTSVTPLSPERYKLQLTMSRETHGKLRRAQDLLRHTVPNGDPAEIFDLALTLLLADLERRRCAAVSAPRAARRTNARSRHIPAAVKREVCRRDEGQCAFVGTHGRCAERGFLEIHHVQPFADGGPATVENLQLRCRAHNAYEASLWLGGGGGADCVREARAEW